MEPDIAGLLSQFKSIKKHAGQLYVEPVWDSIKEIEGLVEEYSDAKIGFETIRYEYHFTLYLGNIDTSDLNKRYKAVLRKICMECDKAIGVLVSIATPLSKEDLDQLKTLREELEKLSEGLDINYERNLNEAINEYEKGHHLASALISGRVIIYAMNKIPGESDENKVKFLRDKGIIEKGRKDVQESILKASRLARNLFSHDIKVFPKTSEALSLLSDAIGILEIVSKL